MVKIDLFPGWFSEAHYARRHAGPATEAHLYAGRRDDLPEAYHRHRGVDPARSAPCAAAGPITEAHYARPLEIHQDRLYGYHPAGVKRTGDRSIQEAKRTIAGGHSRGGSAATIASLMGW